MTKQELVERMQQGQAWIPGKRVKIDFGGSEGAATLPPAAEKWLEGVAKNLQGHRGSSLVITGEQQSPEVHAIVHAINAALLPPNPKEFESAYSTEALRALLGT